MATVDLLPAARQLGWTDEADDGVAKANLGTDLDTMWLCIGAILVFFMQTGFAMLEAGSVSLKNTNNILLKNVLDASIGCLAWYFTGFGIAWGAGKGGAPSGFGSDQYALKNGDFEDGTGVAYASWLFQWAFCAATATIVSGAVAERCTLAAYFTYSVCLTAFIYPVVVHWGWSPDGWASAWREKDLLIGCGAVDFAGSGVVHMTGGVAAVIGAKMLGARKDPNPDLPAQSYVFQTLGVLILWTGWYGFNGVSTVAINGLGQVAAKAMVTTTISAGTGAIATVFTTALYEKKENGGMVIKLSSANNGVLAGLVSITAGCSTVDPYGAFIIGLLAAPVYVFASKLLKRLGIDDVVDAFPIHGVCGFYGVFMTGLFATKNNFASAYYADRAEKCAGVFYGGDGSMLAANITMLLAIIAWTGTCSTFVFGILYKLNLLRVSEEVEDEGMDISEHGIKPTKAAPPTDGKQQLEVASTEI